MLGAHSYVDTAGEDVAAALQRMGDAKAILATAPSGKAIAALVPGLAVRGKLIVVGVAPDAIEVYSQSLVFGGRSIYGSLTGSAIDTEDTLVFSVLQDVRPMTRNASAREGARGLRSHDRWKDAFSHGVGQRQGLGPDKHPEGK